MPFRLGFLDVLFEIQKQDSNWFWSERSGLATSEALSLPILEALCHTPRGFSYECLMSSIVHWVMSRKSDSKYG